MITNLTPHPLYIYPSDCPDRIELGSVKPLYTVNPSGDVARIAETTWGTVFSDRFIDPWKVVAIEAVGYGEIDGLPPYAGHMDWSARRDWYVVSLVVALAARGRADLLVPYRDVRTLSGTVIGCRQLARPV